MKTMLNDDTLIYESIGIVDKWFHNFNDNGEIKNQGQILSSLGDGNYLAQLYGWLDGSETDQLIFHVSTMKNWKFYNTSDEMSDAYERYIAARQS
jgi:hypothetical protein